MYILQQFSANRKVLQKWGLDVDVRDTGFAVAPKDEGFDDAHVVAATLSGLAYFCRGLDTYHSRFARLGIRPDPDDFKWVELEDDSTLLLVAYTAFLYIEVETFPVHDVWEVEQFIEGFCFAAEHPINDRGE